MTISWESVSGVETSSSRPPSPQSYTTSAGSTQDCVGENRPRINVAFETAIESEDVVEGKVES